MNLSDDLKQYLNYRGARRRTKQQEIENLFEQIMKGNFPNLVREIGFQEVQEAQSVPKKLDPKRNTPRHIIIKLPNIKDKEKILKAARENPKSSKRKGDSYLQKSAHKAIS